MILLNALATLVLSQGHTALVCPVQGEDIDTKGVSYEYSGAKFWMCCGGCPQMFAKTPEKFVEKMTSDHKVAGLSIFDPVSHIKVDEKKAIKETSDFNGVRYMFSTTEDKKAFDLEPAKYAKAPDKESLTCPGSKEKIASASAAYGYADYKGVRYYFCCPDCFKEFKTEADKMVANVTDSVKPLAVMATPKKEG